MSPISFNEVPSNVLVPSVLVEFDASRAQQGPAIQAYRVLVIGQRLSAGTHAELVPVRVTSADQAADLFGRGSMLHAQARALFANNLVTEVWMVAQDDAGGATKATGNVVVTGPATASGQLYLYIGGRRLQIGIASGDTATNIGDAIEAAVTADTNLPVTASNAAGTVTLTAKNGGEQGNKIDVRTNFFQGEVTPTGVGVTVPTMASGTGDPSLAAVWPVLGDEQYNILAVGYPSTANLTSLHTELADRWGPLRAIEGVAFAGLSDTHSGLVTTGSAQNSPHVSLIGTKGTPNPPWEVAAAVAGVAAAKGQADPARPFQTLELKTILAPAETDRFTFAERNLLYGGGIASTKAGVDGAVRIDRLVTTYQTNGSGAPDTSYRDVNTLLTLGYIRFATRTHILLNFPRHKLGDDGKRYGVGQAIMTPKLMRAVMVGLFDQWEELALVEAPDQFARDLIVERNLSDPNRLDVRMPPDLVNQFRVAGVQIQFLL